MSPQSLSSDLTIFFKAILPFVWITGFGVATYALWSNTLSSGDWSTISDPQITFLLVWIAGSAIILFLAVPLKEVNLEGSSLRISNFRRQIVVPLELVTEVTENRLVNINPVTIHFRGTTDFGRSVTFMPKMRLLSPFSPHPVVAQLESLAGIGSGAERIACLPKNYRRIALYAISIAAQPVVLANRNPIVDFSESGPLTQRRMRGLIDFEVRDGDKPILGFHDHPNEMWITESYAHVARHCEAHGWLKVQRRAR